MPQRGTHIVGMPRTSKGGNWTISLHSIASDALWEASDIVADIQQAYYLAAADCSKGRLKGWFPAQNPARCLN